MLTTERDQYLRWKEHFQEDLNRKEPDNLAIFPEAPLDLEIDTDPPSKQEIQAAIKSLKNKKSPGIDQLNAELFKIDTVLAADTVHPVFQKIWEQAVIPNITKQLSDKKAKIDMPIKDKNNNMLTTERDQYLRWKEHFQEDLNRKEPDNLEKFPEAPLDLEIDTDPPSKQEIQAAIKSLKNKKSPGIDQLNAELFKIDTVLAADTVHPVFQKIWEQAVIPNSGWRKTWAGDTFFLHRNNDWGILMFATDEELKCLQKCFEVYIDGTFRTCPRPYEQYVTIYGKYRNRVLCFVNCIMTGRQVGQYRQVLQSVKAQVRRASGHRWRPTTRCITITATFGGNGYSHQNQRRLWRFPVMDSYDDPNNDDLDKSVR
ncbi:unnamed protein product [Mytilus edulis]|uniref:Uncharacterized protein n=1 Tax=Mytilus edulis TaxID=6550 RepID=A0A8S3V3L0_MYTED|nr:unnamed protein product [Mytilus edulis]